MQPKEINNFKWKIKRKKKLDVIQYRCNTIDVQIKYIDVIDIGTILTITFNSQIQFLIEYLNPIFV